MFYSAETLYNFYKTEGYAPYYLRDRPSCNSPVSKSKVKKYVKACKASILSRDMSLGEEFYYDYVGKWTRPWDVVPAIKNFQAPEGDYGIGIEVEMGFNSLEDAQFIAKTISNWRHIAIDEEGGNYPLEVTFPPFLYSKLSANSQPCRYLKLLKKESYRVARHYTDDEVGTHVNVSKGGVSRYDSYRLEEVNSFLEDLSYRERLKFFGREPYGLGNTYGKDNVIEWKLFNSVTDYKVLKRYINIAVALTDVVASDVEITEEVVMNALNLGYNKPV